MIYNETLLKHGDVLLILKIHYELGIYLGAVNEKQKHLDDLHGDIIGKDNFKLLCDMLKDYQVIFFKADKWSA